MDPEAGDLPCTDVADLPARGRSPAKRRSFHVWKARLVAIVSAEGTLSHNDAGGAACGVLMMVSLKSCLHCSIHVQYSSRW